MKQYTLELAAAALSDLDDITRYVMYTLKEPQTAKNLGFKLGQGIQSLAVFPARCPVIEEAPYHFVGMRRLLVENYAIYYHIKEDRKTVYIFRVLYNRREWRSLLDDVLS